MDRTGGMGSTACSNEPTTRVGRETTGRRGVGASGSMVTLEWVGRPEAGASIAPLGLQPADPAPMRRPANGDAIPG
jgi:hypothetical protein